MLTKIKNFVKKNLTWLTFGLCLAILVVNLGQCVKMGPRKGSAAPKHVEKPA